MSGTLCEHELEKVSYFLDLWYLSDSSYLAEVLMPLPNPHHLCLIAADAPRWHLFYYVLILVGHSVREYISYHAKILFRRLFQFLISGGKRMSGISFTTRIYCKKTAECTFHNPRAGTLSKLFSSSEALLVFFLYGQTLYTAIIFPDGDEHVYRWTEQLWSEIWKKKVKPGNVIKKLNLSEVNVSDPDLMSSLQLLFCHFVYDKIDDKTSYPWMIHRWIFLFWISTQEHVLNHGMCSAGNLHD